LKFLSFEVLKYFKVSRLYRLSLSKNFKKKERQECPESQRLLISLETQ